MENVNKNAKKMKFQMKYQDYVKNAITIKINVIKITVQKILFFQNKKTNVLIKK